MTTLTHCSLSRSSVSCQFDHGSQDNMRDTAIIDNNNVLQREKQSFPKRPELDLSFRDIRYRVREWNIRNFSISEKEILHGVKGEFKSGELVAIMGPSGAGKSTLLNALAGFTVKGVSGEVRINGKVRELQSKLWKRMSCYIHQDTILTPYVTVGETMTLAAHLKLGCTISSAYKHTQVSELLEMLGLSHCYDTLCGKLSGGQKKELDIALELLTNPSILFLDEPTTGLDSFSSSQCVALMKRLAELERRTVICTIHQPSASLLEKFDSLYVMADGHCIYRGPVRSLIPHLASVGAQCPFNYNVADFVIEVAIGEYGVELDKLVAAAETIPNDEKQVALTARQPEENKIKEPPLPAGFLTQCYFLCKRRLLSLKRHYSLLLERLLCHLLIGVLFGYLYMGIGYQANSLGNYGYLYGSLMFLVFTGKMTALLAIPLEMRILMKEHFNCWYRLAPYYISLLLVEVFFQAACATSYLMVSYWLTDQPAETNRIILFMLVSIATSLTAQAWGFFIGVIMSIKIAVIIGPIIATLFSVFSFAFPYIDMPYLFRWMFHISYFRAGLQSLIYTIYGYDREDLKCDKLFCYFKKPRKFLIEINATDINVINNLVLILGIGVLMHFLTASALWCKLRR
ncbi:ATP-binding cassette sub-family G member 1-like isoform X2 [Solenopsis invicta]|uniref:ATP-binding cassette sub-family G member 1-like isoform X2 n=1 Tax=Solenopsis invicta TaxID=13686 RepID=UPI00193E2EC7|nr:ATP-binding cassette sub-family G member 1-like isoform X2 [Solenopsis invicta]